MSFNILFAQLETLCNLGWLHLTALQWLTSALIKQVASSGVYRYRIGAQRIGCLTLIRGAPYSILPSGAVSSAVEHRSYTPRATGSNPVPPTTKDTILPLLIVFVSFVQDLMYEGDRNRSLADR